MKESRNSQWKVKLLSDYSKASDSIPKTRLKKIIY